MSSMEGVESSLVAHSVTWDSFGLDPRLTRAVTKLGWTNPTLVQSASIPRVLQGKDVLAKARTGSGKTAAYAVPMVQKILTEKEGMKVSAGVRALLLVPTRELCEQASEVVSKLVMYCHHLVRHVTLANDTSVSTQEHALAELPDIVIATPGRLVQHLQRGTLKLVNTLKMIVVDEADLVFSYGYEQDMNTIATYMPKICQGFLASATLGAAVESLKKLILHTPVVLKLEEEKDKRLLLQQFAVRNYGGNERFLQLYVLLKLKVISGKTIVFVNSIEGCYRLKLFLERMSIKSAVLNSELPQNSRYHIVQEFNRGLFSILIATDEANKGEADDSDSESSASSAASSDAESEGEEANGAASDEDDAEEDVSSSSDSESPEPVKPKKGAKKVGFAEEPKKKAVVAKKGKKVVESSSESEDDSEEDEELDAESFDSDMSVDDDEDLIEDMDMSDSEEESSEDETVESARKNVKDVIEEIDSGKSVSKNAIKVMSERLAAVNKAEKREAKEAEKNGKSAKKAGDAGRRDAEYGVSRGVDFRGIKTVVNFDFPRTSRAYTHRVGRTARAGQAGTALSFVLDRDSDLLEKVAADQKAEGLEVKPYLFNSAALDSFRYRVEGVLRTVTELSIREARYEEIRREILGSQKLQTFFEENPREMALLQHDKTLLESKINHSLRVVPDYILSPKVVSDAKPLAERDFEEEYLEHFGVRRKRFGKRRLTSDPLKTFSSAKRHKGRENGGKSSRGKGGKRPKYPGA